MTPKDRFRMEALGVSMDDELDELGVSDSQKRQWLDEMEIAVPLRCKQCGGIAEEARRCYATPVCFACLPPPKPLKIALLKSQMDELERHLGLYAELAKGEKP